VSRVETSTVAWYWPEEESRRGLVVKMESGVEVVLDELNEYIIVRQQSDGLQEKASKLITLLAISSFSKLY